MLEGQNVRNFPYPVRIRWSRQPNLVPFYLYNRIFECPENIRNDGFPDFRWPSESEVSNKRTACNKSTPTPNLVCGTIGGTLLEYHLVLL